MPDQNSQNLATHVRYHPPFHFFAVPANATALVLSVINVIKHPDVLASWTLVFLAAGVLVATFLVRLNALKAQDRVIRLEERLRLNGLLSDPLRSRIGELTESQLIALRFASDAECPSLVEKALAQKLGSKQIKQSIVHWRADTFRV